MPAKVAIDISPLKTAHAVRGVGSYTKNLIEALGREIQRGEEQELEINPWDFSLQSSAFSHQQFDLLHYPHFDLFYLTLPLRKPTKTVVTIHDVIPLVFPEHYPPGLKGKIKFLIQRFSLKGVAAVLTDSANSKRDIVKYLGYPAEKIHVIYLVASDKMKKLAKGKWISQTKKRYRLPDKFILYVGDVNWNKNIVGLVKACKKIKTPLVIVGKQAVQQGFDRTHIENQPLVQLIEQYGEDPDILRIGFIEDEDLVKIYNLATVYCQPSFYEGFGIPVLEAMTCGCPVAASNVSSLPEICGDAALLFDPKDYNEIAICLHNILSKSELRNKLIFRGFNQAAKFSWEKTAKEVIKIYFSLLK